MNIELEKKIEKVRYALHDELSASTIGKLNNGLKCTRTDIPKVYCEFLEVCDGARCGAIDLWSKDLIFCNQYKVAELTGDNEKWLCIGQILYEPLIINVESEYVYLFLTDYENDMIFKCFGKFDIFLNDFVFGNRYAEIIPDYDKEKWYIFLKKISLI